MTSPGLAAGHPQQLLAALGGAHRAGEQRDGGGVGVAAEHPPGRQVAEHRGDRAVVLLGEHLGGREQRRLGTGVDDPQHRPQRHQRLAGADLALEQPVHRVRLGQVALELLADLHLARGQREGQPGVEGREQSAPTGPGDGTLGTLTGPAPGEHQLGHQRLLEAEALLGGADLLVVVGTVDPPERGQRVEQVVLAA